MADRVRFNPAWWVALVALGVVWACIGLMYPQTLRAMFNVWSTSDTYAHGFVVPLISLWLVWRIREPLLTMVPSPSGTAWVLLLGVVLLWLAGDLVAVNAATQLALVLMVMLAVPAVLGWGVSRRMAFPLAFLLFAVPVGDFMLPWLMERTADFTVLALRASGIPVYREGLQFVIPSGTWSVVEACSGIRYLIASFTVGCLFAYLSFNSLSKRLIFLGVAILVPLVANWLRAYMIVMIGHLSGNELATGVDHLIYGWLFFGVVILGMLFVGARWSDAPVPLEPSAPVAAGAAGSVQAGLRRTVWVTLVVVAVLASPSMAYRLFDRGVHAGPVNLVAPPALVPWQAASQTPVVLRPAFHNPVATADWGYLGPGQEHIGLHLSYYRQQGYDRKLVSSVNALVASGDSAWAVVANGRASATWLGETIGVTESLLRARTGALTADADRLLVWRLYWVNDRFVAGDVQAKLQTALSRVSGQGDDGAIMLLYVLLPRQVADDGEAMRAARTQLSAYVASQGASLQQALRQFSAQP
jgi:exosortase A